MIRGQSFSLISRLFRVRSVLSHVVHLHLTTRRRREPKALHDGRLSRADKETAKVKWYETPVHAFGHSLLTSSPVPSGQRPVPTGRRWNGWGDERVIGTVRQEPSTSYPYGSLGFLSTLVPLSLATIGVASSPALRSPSLVHLSLRSGSRSAASRLPPAARTWGGKWMVDGSDVKRAGYDSLWS